MNIEEIAGKTYLFETSLSGMETIFSVYLINSEETVLLEPGPAAAIPAILKGMEQIGMKTISYIMPTHIHIDHGGAIGKLAQLFPEAKVVIHPQGVRHVVDPSRLIQSTKMAFGDDFETRYGQILPVPQSQVKVPADEELIYIGDRELRVIYARAMLPTIWRYLMRRRVVFSVVRHWGCRCRRQKPSRSHPLPHQVLTWMSIWGRWKN